MRKIEAVIFDMDGLMVDSERAYYDTALEVSKTDKYKNFNITENLILGCVGMRRVEMFDYLNESVGNGFDAKLFNQECMIVLYEKAKTMGLKKKKGLDELLTFLKENKIKIAIASSSQIKTIKDKFIFANLDESYFDLIVSGDMVTKAKPDPEIYLKTLEKLSVNPENVFVLEDSEVGALAGISAGLKTILIPDMKEASKETESKVYKKLTHLGEVIDLIKNFV